MPLIVPPEHLDVDAIVLADWVHVMELERLWDGGDIDDEDLHIDGASGERELPQFLHPLECILPAVFIGDRDRTGATVSGVEDCRQNLYENVAYFKANVCSPIGTLPSTRPFTLYLPDGVSTLDGDIRISRRLDLRRFGGSGENDGSPFNLAASLSCKVVAGEPQLIGS